MKSCSVYVKLIFNSSPTTQSILRSFKPRTNFIFKLPLKNKLQNLHLPRNPPSFLPHSSTLNQFVRVLASSFLSSMEGGGGYVTYNLYGNLFEVSTKYGHPLRPIGRGASGLVWFVPLFLLLPLSTLF